MADDTNRMTRPGAEDIRRIVGPIDDRRLAMIEELRPSLADVKAAAACSAGADEAMHEQRQPLAGKVAAIFDLLEADLAEDDR